MRYLLTTLTAARAGPTGLKLNVPLIKFESMLSEKDFGPFPVQSSNHHFYPLNKWQYSNGI